MIKFLFCWIFGHKFTEKVPAGNYTVYGFMGDAYNANKYTWKQVAFCTRCGVNNPHFIED
jgi:hypothetical protein